MNANDQTPNGSAAFRALRRATSAPDSAFAAATAPNIPQVIAETSWISAPRARCLLVAMGLRL
jgi:hypothetical protein